MTSSIGWSGSRLSLDKARLRSLAGGGKEEKAKAKSVAKIIAWPGSIGLATSSWDDPSKLRSPASQYRVECIYLYIQTTFSSIEAHEIIIILIAAGLAAGDNPSLVLVLLKFIRTPFLSASTAAFVAVAQANTQVL